MKYKQFNKAVGDYLCGASDYQWDCYPDAKFADVSDIDGTEVGGCIWNPKTKIVYQVEVFVPEDKVAFRWIDPAWSLEYGIEAERRGVDKFKAYDDVEFTNIDSEEEILQILKGVVHKTYVHSSKLSEDVKKLSPASPWPFPLMGKPSSKKFAPWPFPVGSPELVDDSEDSNGEFDVNEYHQKASVFDEPVVEEKEYEVVLTVKHRFSVKARNMEAAIDKAKEFQENMKSGEWPAGLSWEDRWVSKSSVTKRFETTQIEE